MGRLLKSSHKPHRTNHRKKWGSVFTMKNKGYKLSDMKLKSVSMQSLPFSLRKKEAGALAKREGDVNGGQ